MNNTCRLQIILLLLMFFTQANSLEGNANSVSSNTNGTHNYYYNDKSLDKVLAQIASNNNLNLNIASDISSKTLKQTVNGRITATSMDDLLDTLGQNYGFKWFSKSGGLFISSNRQISKAIEVSGNSIENIQYILKAEGVLNDKFGFSALPSENKIIISGPENYVNGVVSSIK
jgi:type II secretory pathway component GspD/PulD (secretin)